MAMTFEEHVQEYMQRNGLTNFDEYLSKRGKHVEITCELEEKLAEEKKTVDEYIEEFLNSQLYMMLYDKEWITRSQAFDTESPAGQMYMKQACDYCKL